MDIDGYSTKITIDGWIQMDILLKLKEMDIDGYSTKIRIDGWIKMILLKLKEMD